MKKSSRRRRRLPSKVKVGRYFLDGQPLDLFLLPNEGGGSFKFGGNDVTHIYIGGSYAEWWRVLSVLLHEAFEISMSRAGRRFAPDLDYCNASDRFVFLMDHAQFSEVTARAAEFVAHAVPDLVRAYNKYGHPARSRK